MLWLANNVSYYGWMFIFWPLITLYVEKDVEFKNRGYDIISFKKLGHSYFYGTYSEYSRFINLRD
jgi:hypothetical protein